MPAWCLICAALLACLSPAQPTKSLDLSLTLTNNVIHVNDVPEHLLTMYPVCTRPSALLLKSTKSAKSAVSSSEFRFNEPVCAFIFSLAGAPWEAKAGAFAYATPGRAIR